jgi:hypothetical protein
MASDEVIPARCGRAVTVQMEGPLEAAGSLMGPTPEATAQQGVFKERMPKRDTAKMAEDHHR